MTREQLLALDLLSTKSPEELRETRPDLFAALEPKLVMARKETLTASFADATKDLRLHVDNVEPSVPKGVLLREVLLDSLQEQEIEGEVAAEAVEHLLDLELSGRFTDPAQLDVPIKDHPLFAAELQRAGVYKLAGAVRLPDERSNLLVEVVPSVQQINDTTLGELIEKAILSTSEAKRMGLGATVSVVADQKLEVVDVLQTMKFPRLGERTLENLRDVVQLEVDDWLRVLEEAKPSLPEGVELADYAELLHRRSIALLPTDALLLRTLPTRNQGIAEALTRIAPLFGKNPEPFGRPFDSLNLDEIPEESVDAFRQDHELLQGIAYLNPGLAITEILNSEENAEEKQTRIRKRINGLATVYENNPTSELLTIDYTPEYGNSDSLDFGDLDETETKQVVAGLKAIQRTFAIAKDSKVAIKIMKGGYSSATAVAEAGFEEFQASTGLGEEEAYALFKEAEGLSATAAVASGVAIDIILGGYVHPNLGNLPRSTREYLEGFKGYASMFGNQDFCACDHCQSVLGPVAYFVDLMRFVDQNITRTVFSRSRTDHDLSLKKRRPDLWTVPLTCSSATELVPYLKIIIRALEDFIATAWNPGVDLRDRPLVEKYVYEMSLFQSAQSFRQPFHLPHEKLVHYLRYFGQKLGDIAKSLGLAAEEAARFALEIPFRDFSLITHPNTDIVFLRLIYGIPFVVSNGKIEPVDVQDLVKFTGVPRDELESLCSSSFVSDYGRERIWILKGKRSPSSVQYDMELMYGLTLGSLDRLHRFTRFRRIRGWSVSELDLILAHLKKEGLGTGLSVTSVTNLLEVEALRARFTLSVEVACAIWSSIPETPLEGASQSLFDRLFNPSSIVSRDGALPKPGVKFIHPSFRDDGLSAPSDLTLHRLLAALQLSDEDFARLLRILSVKLGMDLSSNNEEDRGFFLSIANLSLLFRHARLARLLSLSMSELQKLLILALPSGPWIVGVAELRRVLDFHEWRRRSPFTQDELLFLIDSPHAPTKASDVAEAAAEAIVLEVRNSRALLFSPTALAFVPGLTEDDSRAILDDPANAGYFEIIEEGAAYRLTTTFGESSPISIPSGGASEAQVRSALLAYHTSRILPKQIGARFSTTLDKLPAFLSLGGADLFNANLIEGLQGGARGELESLLATFARLATLFREEIYDEHALRFIAEHRAMFGVQNFKVLDVDGVARLLVYSELKVEDPRDLEMALHAVVGTALGRVAQQAIARVLRVDESLIASLLPHVVLPPIAADAIRALQAPVRLASGLGVDGEILKLCVSSSYAEIGRAAEGVYRAIRARASEEDEFQKEVGPYDDAILSRTRDGLVDYLLRADGLEFESESDLYAHFLLDTMLEGCARTSWIVAASSSLQLYIHRILMNFERDRRAPTDPEHVRVAPDRVPKEEWEWRKNYRVWEANRKVFLFPESYIEPELRDDKTPLFEELESTLLQQPIDEQSVSDAFSTYLKGLEELAQLEIAGSYQEKDAPGRDILHLFGVTRQDPPTYYYRAIENIASGEVGGRGVVYGPWQQVDLQIPVRKVSPIVFQGRLYVFWYEAATIPKNEVKDGNSQFVGYKHTLSLKYSVRKLSGEWSVAKSIRLVDDEIFDKGDGIVDDPVGSRRTEEEKRDADDSGIITEMYTSEKWDQTPRFATDPHDEPLEGYRLLGAFWQRVFPCALPSDHPWNAIFLCASKRDVFHRLDLLRGGIETGRTLFYERGNVLSSRFDSEIQDGPKWEFHGRRRLFFSATNGSWLRLNYFKRTLISDSRDLHEADRTLGIHFERIDGVYQNEIAEIGESTQIDIVNGASGDALLGVNGDHFLIQCGLRSASSVSAPTLVLRRLGTTLVEPIARAMLRSGIVGLLDSRLQESLSEGGLPFQLKGTMVENRCEDGTIDFTGSMGTCFRELFFHAPFLIANHLNSQGEHLASQRWYNFIFDPAADSVEIPADTDPDSVDGLERNRVWRYLEFRHLEIPNLLHAITDTDGIPSIRMLSRDFVSRPIRSPS